MKSYVKMIIAGAVILLVGIVILVIALGINGWQFSYDFETKTYTCDEEITSLKIDFSAGTLVTKYVDDDKITVEYPENEHYSLNFKAENGVLTARTDTMHFWTWFGFFTNIPQTTIYIPVGSVLDLDLDIKAGTARLAAADYGKVNVHMSAGTLNMSDCNSDTFDCEMSAGTVNLQNVVCGKFEADISAGTINVNTLTCPDINTDISAGTANLKIHGAKSDYTISVDESAGSCNVSNQTGGNKRLYIDISAGSCNVSFTN